MKKFAIAILSFHDNDNKLFIVEAETKRKAITKVLLSFYKEELNDDNLLDWINSMEDEDKTVEEIQEELLDADVSLSNVVEL